MFLCPLLRRIDIILVFQYLKSSKDVPDVGRTYAFGDAQVQFLSPARQYSDISDCSIVVRIVHGSNAFLLTGDAECDAEHDMVASGHKLSSTVLKVGHHGSNVLVS